jgi:hypothetical protein
MVEKLLKPIGSAISQGLLASAPRIVCFGRIDVGNPNLGSLEPNRIAIHYAVVAAPNETLAEMRSHFSTVAPAKGQGLLSEVQPAGTVGCAK